MQIKLKNVLAEQYSEGKRVVLVIDEAQNLDDSVLELVRMLSNFETASDKLIQIILAGQPQLATPPVEVELVHGPEPVKQHSSQHEQRGLGEPVADHVDRDAGQPVRGEQSDPAHEHADVTDRREGQQPFEVALRVAHDRPPQRGDRAERDQDRPQRVGVRAQRAREDRPVQPRHRINAELGHHP